MKKRRIVGISLSSFFAVASVATIIIAGVYANKYSGVLRSLLGTTGRRMTSVHYDGVDQNYYSNKYTKDELIQEEKRLTDSIAEEGIVVLEKGNIPYASGKKLSLFSKSSVNFVFGGTGSGTATSELSLKSSLEAGGFAINQKLWDFYESGEGKGYARGIGSINYGDKDDFSINEVPISMINSNSEVRSSFNEYNTGVFVLSRTGGEGNDLARGMHPYVDTALDMNSGKHPDAEADKYKSYLEPDSIELQVMQYINDNFDDFILIVNCNNAMELDFKDQFPNLSTIVQVPATGENGLNALGKILNGSVASSGKLNDTFVKDSFAIPSSNNIGDFEYLVDGRRMPNITGQDWASGLFYMNYDESIYVGYRYFETRYADALMGNGNAGVNWNYADHVLYPFGYGDSIASFSYSNFALDSDGDNYTVTIDVTNNSDFPAKTPVELYISSPYGNYEKEHNVEKSAIELIAFEKTPLIAENGTVTVTLSFDKEDLRTYMTEGEGQYYISGGEYYVTIGYDAHAANNNVLKAKGVSGEYVASPSEETPGDVSLVTSFYLDQDLDTYKVDQKTGTTIKNQFGFMDARTYDSDHTYLSREDWVGTFPQINGEVSNIVSIHSERTLTAPNGQVGSFEFVSNLEKESQIYKDVVNFATYAPNLTLPSEIKWNQPSNLDFVDLRGLDYDDPRFDEVIDKLSIEEAVELFSNGGYQTASIKSINKPVTFDADGPAGFNTVSGHNSIGFNFPSSIIIAQTWNKDLMHEVGEMFGEESLLYEVNGWYAPTANIHRSPFGGRNFEYFSEDPVMAGEAAKQELHGAAQYGVFGYLKHFALNDQETHREKENGVCIFAEEQSIRELYLKAFERAIKDNTVTQTYYEIQRDADKNIIYVNGQPSFVKKEGETPACTAVMSAFSRFGGCWAGACYPLLTNVLQNEWGFHGVILTDYFHNWFMSKGQSLLGSGSCILDPQDNKFSVSSDDKLSQYMLKLATRNNLYGTVNTNTVNGYIHGTQEIPEWANYKTILLILNISLGTIAGVLILNVLRMVFDVKLFKRKAKQE